MESFIINLQKHSFKLKSDLDNLRTIRAMLTGFNSSDEHESVCQMMAMREMQIECCRNALVF